MSSVPFEMRRSFAIIDDELVQCPRRNTSNYDWLIGERGMTEEEMAATVHGAIYPGRVYFYKGVRTTDVDDDVRAAAEKFRGNFNTDTEVCCGAIPGKIGEMWEPREILGMGTGSSDSK